METMPTVTASPSPTSGRALRAVLVMALWAPVYAAILLGLGRLASMTHVLPLALPWLVGLACTLHACVWRTYGVPTSLTAVVVSPRAARLLWAAALLLPVAGSLAYLASLWRSPEPTPDANRDDTRYASGA